MIFFYGYQLSQRGEYYGVIFHQDHVPSHRVVVNSVKLKEGEEKNSWPVLRQKYPPPSLPTSNKK